MFRFKLTLGNTCSVKEMHQHTQRVILPVQVSVPLQLALSWRLVSAVLPHAYLRPLGTRANGEKG